jgi:hypothetical protein
LRVGQIGPNSLSMTTITKTITKPTSAKAATKPATKPATKRLTSAAVALGFICMGASCKKDDDVRRVDETRPGVATERVGAPTGENTAPGTRPLTEEERARIAAGGTNTGTGTTVTNTGTGTTGTGTGTTGTGAAATGMTGTATGTAGSPVAAGGTVSDPNSPVYGNCMTIINKMRACAKDPGFKTYQTRWTSKGAAPAGTKAFERRIDNWQDETGRRNECDAWSQRKEAEAHLGARSKLGESLKDAKLTCTLFAQELDDDGWVPGVMAEAPRESGKP